MAEQTMVERVAAAIHAQRYGEGATWDRVRPEHQERYRRSARAAIEAMRVPTEAMYGAGFPACGEDGHGPDKVWELMIDAALEGKNNG